ncbi:hypothetical protein D8X55_00545 [Malacoplasma penetrans]|uniref:Uncharacterized protein n=1 Tax=Malacoplasma penetrans (strain HF-2) TaxID=272633 RepID=Q8EX41_MALP2|nr:hypothetical protein [Malacoplasma penetrans]RXY97406.1 hypothetical protein D8X55_00545 [Malacoplasma penetrans]BAC43799.1 hypothetical protein [Malacoplasma penetrans HF-2]
MASKKRKFTFTDLADDDFVDQQENQNTTKPSENINFTLNDLKNDQKPEPIVQQNNHSVEKKETNQEPTIVNTAIANNEPTKSESLSEEIIYEKYNLENDNQQPSSVENNNKIEVQNTETDNKNNQVTEKKVYEVNYDDILNDSVPQKNKEVIDSLIEKKDPIKELFNTKEEKENPQNSEDSEQETKVYKNLKPRSTVKTYNEALKKQEQRQVDVHFEENKIKQFLNVREKLEVKTNIYLKNSIVIKLSELEARTNESRSSIINKLIEIALKTIEE